MKLNFQSHSRVLWISPKDTRPPSHKTCNFRFELMMMMLLIIPRKNNQHQTLWLPST